MTQKHVMSYDIMPLIKELLDNHQTVELKVSGTSMRPFYEHHQTTVTLKHPDSLNKYDVVLYFDKGHYKLHRIIKIKDGECVICGDALTTLEHVNKRYIFGVVESHTYGNFSIHSSNKKYRRQVKTWIMLKPIRKILLKLMYFGKRAS